MFSRTSRVLLLAAIACCAAIADGATYTWNVTSGTWTDNLAWTPTSSSAGVGPYSVDGIVFTGASNQTIDLGGALRTVNNVAYTGVTLPLTITATSGSLTINGGNQSFGATANGSLVTDYSGLSKFEYSQTGVNTFDVRMSIPASPTSGTATLKLATQGSGTNLITADTIQIGAAAGTSGGTAWGGVLGLGKANTLRTTNFLIGGFNGSGAVSFQQGITGTLVLRGTGGSTNVTKITVGETSSGTRDGSGTLDLTGGSVDLQATTMVVGRHGSNSNTPAVSGTFTMPAGTANVSSLVVGEKNTGGSPAINATFNQSGGLVTSGTLRLGNIITSTIGTNPTITSVYNLSSGTLRAVLMTTEPSVAMSGSTQSNASSVRKIAWSGGAIANYDASTNLTISGTNTNAGYTMSIVLGSTTTPQVFLADASRTITLGSNAVVSGTGYLQKQGAGTLRINTAATYSGSTAITGGTIQLGVANGLPVATTLALTPSSGTATLDLNGFSQTLSSLSSSGAGTAIVDVSTGTSTLTVGGDNSSTTFAGRLRNSGASTALAFTKNGTGTWTLTGSNSAVAGALLFSNGKVTVDPGAAGTFTSTGRFQVAPGAGNSATLEILSGTASFSSAAAIAGIGDGSGTSSMNAAGGSTTFALSSNRLVIGNKGTGSLNVSGGSFTITGTPDLVVGGDQQYALNNASGSITVSSGTLSITGSGNLVLGRNQTTGGSTTGANGTISLNGGVFSTLRAITMDTGSAMGSGTVNFNGGTLRALGSSTNFIAVTTANVQNGGAVIDTNSFNVTIAQALQNAGSGGLTKLGAGTLTLSAANAYAGSTTVNAGTLKAGDASAFGAGAITVAGGATLDLNSLAVANAITNNGGSVSNAGGYAGTQTLAGSASFGDLGGSLTVASGGVATLNGLLSGGMTVNGGGKAILGATGTVAGPVTVNSNALLGGIGTIANAVTVYGTVGPGNSPGLVTFDSLSLQSSATTLMELNGTARGTGYDAIDIVQSAGLTYDGTLSLVFGSAFDDNTSFDLFSFTGGATGGFASVVSTGSYAGTWTNLGGDVFELPNVGTSNMQTLTFTASTGDLVIVPEPGALALMATGALAAAWTIARSRRRLV